MSAERSRQELARFLRVRRGRIMPGDVGLPNGRHRRTHGLRREEVAVLAGLSPTWYTYLEQARKIHPSPDVLDSLAQVFRMSEDERRYLHQLASGHIPTPPPGTIPATDTCLVTELVEVAGSGPYPLYALDYAGEVIAWNAAAAEWYTDWSVREGLDRNIVWWMLTSDEAKERIVDWADDARDITGRTRAMSARHLRDSRIRELVDRLHQHSPDFRRWWEEYEVRGQQWRPRRLRHPTLGVRAMRLTVVHPNDDMRVTIAFHLPLTPADRLPGETTA